MAVPPQWHRPRSIAARIITWYAVSAFALVLVASGILYTVLVDGLVQEDSRTLSDTIAHAGSIWRTLQAGESPSAASAAELSRGREIYLRVLDANGRSLFESSGMAQQAPAPERSILLALNGSVQNQLTSRSGKPLLVQIVRFARRNGEPFFLQAVMDRSYDADLLARYREQLFLVLALSLIACAVIGYVIAKSGLRPVENIARNAERIQAPNALERIETAGLPTELFGLAITFNAMLDRLGEAFARIQQFSGDVAHELRTPVNNLRSELDVALRRERTPQQYADVLGSSLEECDRISRIVESLLFLSKAEQSETLRRETAQVRGELEAVRDFYEPACAEAGVTLDVAAADELSASVDRTLFRQAVTNLVSNALAHTGPRGRIEITARIEGGALRIEVSDNGCGIDAKHLPHVCERFYRADSARADSARRSGLGLSIVKAIVERHGGRLDIQSQVGVGTIVALSFPSSP